MVLIRSCAGQSILQCREDLLSEVCLLIIECSGLTFSLAYQIAQDHVVPGVVEVPFTELVGERSERVPSRIGIAHGVFADPVDDDETAESGRKTRHPHLPRMYLETDSRKYRERVSSLRHRVEQAYRA